MSKGFLGHNFFNNPKERMIHCHRHIGCSEFDPLSRSTIQYCTGRLKKIDLLYLLNISGTKKRIFKPFFSSGN